MWHYSYSWMLCVERGEGGPFYSPNRSVPALNKYGNIVHRLGMDQIKFPASGSAGPQVPPLAPPFILVTGWWAPILCMSVPGLCTSVFSVKWAHLVSVTQDEVFCVFLLRLMLVFSLFRVWVPANQESPKLVELIRINSYIYIWCLIDRKSCRC